jgi:hypothetical protein
MKKGFLAFAFCLLVVSGSFAQTKQESIKQLFHIMKTDSITEQMFTSILSPMMNQMQLKDSVSQAHLKEKMNSMMQIMKSISTKMLNEDMLILYDKYFTQEDITDFISFYKTTSGQKMINATPEMTKEIMAIMMQKYMPEIKKAMMEKIEEKK